MAKNMHQTAKGQICAALTVPAGTKSGDVVFIGSSTLKGHALTDAATSDTVANGTAAPGLTAGQATVELVGVSLAVKLTVAAGGSLGDKVYKVTADNTYSGTATGGKFIGHALADWTAGAVVPVGLMAG